MKIVHYLVAESGAYTAQLEEADGRIWVHNRVFVYSPWVKQELKRDIEHLHKQVSGQDLWCMRRNTDQDIAVFDKFVRMMGFIRQDDEVDGDGVVCRVYRKEKSIGKLEIEF